MTNKEPDFIKILEDQLKFRADKFNKKRKRDPALSPSSIGHPCYRKIYYDYWKFEQDTPFDPKSEIILSMGSKLHEMVQDWFRDSSVYIPHKNTKYKYDVEFPVTAPDLLIRKGKLDGILKIDNKLWVLEVKTIHDIGFDFLTEPKEDHKMQGMLYVYLFERNLAEGKYEHCDEAMKAEDGSYLPVAGIIYLYLNKNSAKLKAYPLRKDEGIFTEVLKKIDYLEHHVRDKILPSKRPIKLCRWCQYRNACKADKNVGD